MIKHVKKLIRNYDYNKIFISTEEQKYLDIFKKNLKTCVCLQILLDLPILMLLRPTQEKITDINLERNYSGYTCVI